MKKTFNFKFFLFRILFSYILIAIISISTISSSSGYYFNRTEKIYTQLEMFKNGVTKESEFGKNANTKELSNFVNIEKIEKNDYFRVSDIYKLVDTTYKKACKNNIFTHKVKNKYVALGIPVYNRSGISGNAINIIKKSIEKRCNLLLYNFTRKLRNF
jgi:hypothetical protein